MTDSDRVKVGIVWVEYYKTLLKFGNYEISKRVIRYQVTRIPDGLILFYSENYYECLNFCREDNLHCVGPNG